MEKVEIINYDNWSVYDGFAEGSGRGEKLWLQSATGEIGLFKFPKYNPETSVPTTEYISEHLAYKLANILVIETARVDIGYYNNRIGCMSYLINSSDESIIEGATFITGKHPDYDSNLMQETSSGRYYCLDHILEVSDDEKIVNKWIEMMMFDYLIGNTDRHQNNWALLENYKDRQSRRACPLYDNGSSLCCYINEEDIKDYLGKDVNRFNGLVDTKSRSMIRIDGYNKKRPTHLQVVKELVVRFPYARTFGNMIVDKLNEEVIIDLLGYYKELLTDGRRELIKRFLFKKVDMLKQILRGDYDGT